MIKTAGIFPINFHTSYSYFYPYFSKTTIIVRSYSFIHYMNESNKSQMFSPSKVSLLTVATYMQHTHLNTMCL